MSILLIALMAVVGIGAVAAIATLVVVLVVRGSRRRAPGAQDAGRMPPPGPAAGSGRRAP